MALIQQQIYYALERNRAPPEVLRDLSAKLYDVTDVRVCAHAATTALIGALTFVRSYTYAPCRC